MYQQDFLIMKQSCKNSQMQDNIKMEANIKLRIKEYEIRKHNNLNFEVVKHPPKTVKSKMTADIMNRVSERNQAASGVMCVTDTYAVEESIGYFSDLPSAYLSVMEHMIIGGDHDGSMGIREILDCIRDCKNEIKEAINEKTST